MQPMDAKKIKLFDKIVPIFTKGKLHADKPIAPGHRAVQGQLRRRRRLDKTFAKGADRAG